MKRPRRLFRARRGPSPEAIESVAGSLARLESLGYILVVPGDRTADGRRAIYVLRDLSGEPIKMREGDPLLQGRGEFPPSVVVDFRERGYCFAARRVYNPSMDSRYAKNSGAVFSLKYHIVWCPKYRRPVLDGPVAERLKALLAEKTAELGMTIHALEVMPDHVHLFVESDPTMGVAEIVNRLKGFTSRVLRKEFPSLRSRLPTLWTRSYFAGSVGHVSAATVEKYIAEQKGK